jgi:rRNA processing protein Krr1/Pno1
VIGKKYVVILGNEENVALAKKALERLIHGASHSAVFRSLEKKAKELK